MVPAHQKIYSNLDKEVGFIGDMKSDFFKQDLNL